MIQLTRWNLFIRPLLLTCLSTALGLAIGSAPIRAESVIGLTSANSLVTFDSLTPGVVSAAIPITGVGAETILDIDRRPANGLLYGLGSAGNLYVINPTNGIAILNATLTGVNLDPNATRFGIDFNPTVDRLRIVSNTGENLRLSPDTGATTIDGPLNGAASGAVSVAYTNNDTDPATATTLFYIGPSTPTDTFNTLDPNGGVLNLVGAMGVSASQNVGFDISGLSGLAYASLSSPTGSSSSLYTINLTTGAASLVGSIGASTTLRGIAVSTGVIPEPTSLVLLGVGLVSVAFSTRQRRYGRAAGK
jgi:Domain of unknown function (DUF4394)/PEP-CTERM motif